LKYKRIVEKVGNYLPKEFKGTFSAADIHISPDGKFLYATNRGEANNITIFSK
jgi:6-phosphogluconolactonase